MNMAMDVTADQRLTIDRFWGFEINWWPAKIAETAMFLVDHQANLILAKARGAAPERLPIEITAHIIHTNALTLDWGETLPEPSGNTFVFGNPPFLGDSRSGSQTEDLRRAWGGPKVLSRMDYVTGWHAKTLTLLHDHRGEFAFVTTNSITQGDQVPRLFSPIFDAGFIIKFAHRTFAWDSQAPGQAAVHCVIIGFTRDRVTKQRIFDYTTVKSEPHEIPANTSINAYLLDAPLALVEKRSCMISASLNPTKYGSKPSDGGNLIVEPEDYEAVTADPVAAKYLHPYVGARELLHREQRWCLWLEDMDPADLSRSPILKQRVEATREFRAASKAATTRKYPYPHLFRQLAKQDTAFVCVPRHVSETRKYFTVASFDPEVIAGDANFTVRDPDGLQFAVMSSSMFVTWQKAIGGRIKSDLRFASTLTWYTFPFPELDQNTRERICAAGQKILGARSLHPERSLAEHYTPDAMDPALVTAHNALDREIDGAYGSPRRITGLQQRQQILFRTYQQMTAQSG